MKLIHTETRFEEAIEEVLISSEDYFKGDTKSYDKKRALFPSEIISIIKNSQK